MGGVFGWKATDLWRLRLCCRGSEAALSADAASRFCKSFQLLESCVVVVGIAIFYLILFFAGASCVKV